MTPPAAATAKRDTARRAPKTRVHRRVSGPAAAPRATRAVAAPPLPRRRARAAPALGPFGARAVAAGRMLRDSQAVDRLVRGRVWIGILGILLIGLVGLNVSLLKLNAAAGRNAEWAKKLRVENADLRARVSHLRSASRIQEAARNAGFVMPAAADVHYLTANPARDARRAAKRDGFTPSWSDSDIVSAAPDPASIAPVVPAAQAPVAAVAGPTGAQGATGAAGTAAETQVTTPAPTTAETVQPPVGATVP
jgi:cell division protein FtsB